MMNIVINDLLSQEIADFLDEHIEEMKSISPPESKHALDLQGLREDSITFWSVHDNGSLVGCGAIKALNPWHGEIKSMRTAKHVRGKGIASMLLTHILDVAKARGYRRISLETGSMDYFIAARQLYLKYGFKECPPFAQYKEDPNSIFMTRAL